MSSKWRAGINSLSALCGFGLLLIASCETSRGSQGPADPGGSAARPVIHFLTLNIRKDSGGDLPELSLIRQQTAGGFLKPQPAWKYPPYLTCYLYQEKRLIDSVRIEHPLFKRLEFPTSDSTMGSKDTLIGNADFTIRYQSDYSINEIRFSETLPSRITHQLSRIKL